MLTFGTKANRSYSMYLPFKTSFITISCFFSKTSTFLGFQTRDDLQGITKEFDIQVSTFKDLKRSLFSNTFLDIKDYRSDTLDIRNQFSDILPPYSELIQYITNESIKIQKVTTTSGTFNSVLYLYSFSFTDYPGDFLYVLAERQHIDTILNKKLVRTSAIQISTKECLDGMVKMADHYRGEENHRMRKSDHKDSLSDLFPQKNIDDINIKKL